MQRVAWLLLAACILCACGTAQPGTAEPVVLTDPADRTGPLLSFWTRADPAILQLEAGTLTVLGYKLSPGESLFVCALKDLQAKDLAEAYSLKLSGDNGESYPLVNIVPLHAQEGLGIGLLVFPARGSGLRELTLDTISLNNETTAQNLVLVKYNFMGEEDRLDSMYIQTADPIVIGRHRVRMNLWPRLDEPTRNVLLAKWAATSVARATQRGATTKATPSGALPTVTADPRVPWGLTTGEVDIRTELSVEIEDLLEKTVELLSIQVLTDGTVFGFYHGKVFSPEVITVSQ